MTKSQLRQLYKQKRNALGELDVEEKSFQIFNQLQELNIWYFDVYHLFLPIAHLKEINTYTLLQELEFREKQIVLPRVNGQELESVLNNQKTTISTKNKYKIPEPVNGEIINANKIEVVFVPMLACDILGMRVGYGKGFYDRFLQTCQANVLKIGLNFFEPTHDLIQDINVQDVPLDYCVSPTRIVSFSGSNAVM